MSVNHLKNNDTQLSRVSKSIFHADSDHFSSWPPLARLSNKMKANLRAASKFQIEETKGFPYGCASEGC